jgi:hypothetical protein
MQFKILASIVLFAVPSVLGMDNAHDAANLAGNDGIGGNNDQSGTKTKYYGLVLVIVGAIAFFSMQISFPICQVAMFFAVIGSLWYIYKDDAPNSDFLADGSNKKNIFIGAIGSFIWCCLGKGVMYLVAVGKKDSANIGHSKMDLFEKILWGSVSMIGGIMYPFLSSLIQTAGLFQWAELLCLVEKIADMGGDTIMKTFANYIEGDNKSEDLQIYWGALFDLVSVGVSMFLVFCAIASDDNSPIKIFHRWSSVWVYFLAFIALCGYDFFNKLANFSMNAVVDIRAKKNPITEDERKDHRENKKDFITTWSSVFNLGYMIGCFAAIGIKFCWKADNRDVANDQNVGQNQVAINDGDDEVQNEADANQENNEGWFFKLFLSSKSWKLVFFVVYFFGCDGVVTFLMQIPANEISDRTKESMNDEHKDPVEHNMKYGLAMGGLSWLLFMGLQKYFNSSYSDRLEIVVNNHEDLDDDDVLNALKEMHQRKVKIYAGFSIIWSVIFFSNAAGWWCLAENSLDNYNTEKGRDFFEKSFSFNFYSFFMTAVSSGAISPLFFTMQSMLVFLGNADPELCTLFNIAAKLGTAIGRFILPYLAEAKALSNKEITILGYGLAIIGAMGVNYLAKGAKNLQPDIANLRRRQIAMPQNP